MRLVVSPFGNPAAQQRLFGVRQRQVRVGRRHHVVVELRKDAANELALLRNTRFDDGPPVVDVLEGPFTRVEAQLGLPLRGVGAVAAKAAVRQQRANLEAEIDPAGRWRGRLAGVGRAGQAGERGDRERHGKSDPGAHTGAFSGEATAMSNEGFVSSSFCGLAGGFAAHPGTDGGIECAINRAWRPFNL